MLPQYACYPKLTGAVRKQRRSTLFACCASETSPGAACAVLCCCSTAGPGHNAQSAALRCAVLLGLSHVVVDLGAVLGKALALC